jgi:SAM-dependent methyltransferase
MNATIDYGAIKSRQQTAWATGDYAVVGTTLQIVGETLCEALDVRAGMRVLDVAAGNGNASLAAARRFAEVTSTDYVPALLDAARRRADAERLPIRFETADAEHLPYPDGSFDIVMSTFGVMFTPDQERAAGELARVCAPGGRIGLASWTPEGMIGRLFKLIGRYVPPAAGLSPASAWGLEARLATLFEGKARWIHGAKRSFVFRYRSPAHWLEVFRTYYGPINRTFAALEPDRADAFTRDVLALLDEHNRAGDGTLVAPSEYLEAVIERA